MAKNHSEQKAGSRRSTASRDIHDIRSLTATGAIPLPSRRQPPKTGSTEPDRS